MINIVDEAKRLQDEIVTWRRKLHQIPEIGLELPETAKYVASKLDEMNIEYKANVAGYGIVALIKGNTDDKTILLRADMDGLPIKEETGLPFASKNGNMHACGHDTHTAMLLGAAKILNAHKHRLKVMLNLYFNLQKKVLEEQCL